MGQESGNEQQGFRQESGPDRDGYGNGERTKRRAVFRLGMSDEIQVNENNCVRKITRAKTAAGRRMKDPREDIGMQFSLTGRLVSSRMLGANKTILTRY